MEGIHDKSTIEKSPQVLEYERRNNIKHEEYRRGAPERNMHVSNHTRDVSTIGESVTAKRMLTAHIDSHSLNKIQVFTLSFIDC
jgi:3-hydroxy-3-methylglutaryl CoA synthase